MLVGRQVEDAEEVAGGQQVRSPVAGSTRKQRVGCPARSMADDDPTRWPLRVHGPSSACTSGEPAIRRGVGAVRPDHPDLGAHAAVGRDGAGQPGAVGRPADRHDRVVATA